MSVNRCITRFIRNNIKISTTQSTSTSSSQQHPQLLYHQTTCYHRLEQRHGVRYWHSQYLIDLEKRKKEEIFFNKRKVFRRKDFIEWNLEAELFALCSRLNED